MYMLCQSLSFVHYILHYFLIRVQKACPMRRLSTAHWSDLFSFYLTKNLLSHWFCAFVICRAKAAQKVVHIECFDKSNDYPIQQNPFDVKNYPQIVRSLKEAHGVIPDILIPSNPLPKWRNVLKEHNELPDIPQPLPTQRKKKSCKYLRPSIISMGHLG